MEYGIAPTSRADARATRRSTFGRAAGFCIARRSAALMSSGSMRPATTGKRICSNSAFHSGPCGRTRRIRDRWDSQVAACAIS